MGRTLVLPGRTLLRTIVLPGRTILLPGRLASRLVFWEGHCSVLPGRTVFMEQPPRHVENGPPLYGYFKNSNIENFN